MSSSYGVLMAAHRQNLEASGIFTPEPVKKDARRAEALFDRGALCLDLSKVPASFQREASYRAALLLKEIFDRIELPAADRIPDADALEREAAEKQLPMRTRWRVPGTDIVIARVMEGPREGEYLFTPRTVARVARFYDEVKDLPYRQGASVTPGFYSFYVGNPGPLMPPRWNQWLPEWSKRMYFSLAIWQWFALIVLSLLWVLLLIGTFRAFFMRATAILPVGRYRNRALFCLSALLALLVVHLTLRQINISGPVLVFLRLVLHPVFWLLFAGLGFFVARLVAEAIIASPRIDRDGIQASYFRALFTVFGFLIGGAILITGLSRLGISLIPLLTGLGIGGLAIALAARPTLEGLISSFTIFADDPYKLGERVNVMGHNGTVESIGLRSTRIRLLNGHVTSIPNDRMAASEIENIGRRPNIRRLFNITITYDTPPEKIRRAVEILREILAVPADAGANGEPHPNEAINHPGFPPRVFFNEFNSDSLNLIIIYWYHPPDDWWKYMEHAHRVNTQIVERFNGEGIDFAFPTQTVHLAGDEKRPLNVGRRMVIDEEMP